MQIATETERKYDVPETFTLPSLTGRAGVTATGEAETHELDATYFDTDELHLARHRRTLRRRGGGSDAGWHLKTPGDGSSRTEHRLPLGDDADAEVVPDELLAEVRAIVRGRPLRPVARLRTRRVETPLCDDAGRTLALVAQDDVLAETDAGEQRWSELEVELVDGDQKVLRSVEKRLLAAGAAPAGGPSKLARALGDRLTDRPARTAEQDPVLAYARQQCDALVAHDPAVRRGDEAAVHRMRVATRRLRSTLKTFRDHWPRDRAKMLGNEVKWLTERLGEVRDAQVLTKRLNDAAGAEGPQFAPVGARIREHLGATAESGHGALNAALDDARYFRLLDDLDALLDESAGREPVAAKATRRRARKALAEADALLDDATGPDADGNPTGHGSGDGSDGNGNGSGDGSDDGSDGHQRRDDRLHEARKAFKRARYAAEVFEPTVGAPARQLIERLTRLQDVLGTHQDTVVARHRLRELAGAAHAAGENGFPYGILYARQEQAGEASLADLPAVTRAARRPKVRRWLG